MFRKFIIFFTITVTTIFALDLNVKIAKEKGNKYSILNLSSEEDFACIQDRDYEKILNSYTCVFKNAPKAAVNSMDTQFFYIFPSVKNGSFILSIKPKRKSKMFSYDVDPLNQDKQQGVRPSSRKYTIVSYEGDSIPFIKQKEGIGINFPIQLEGEKFPYVKSLDINGIPIVDNPALNDLKEYAEIKTMINKGEYKQAVVAIDRVLKIFPNSIFISEYELFRLKASLASNGAAAVNEIVSRGKAWLKNFPTDEKTADVLLVIANAYAKAQDFNNASYYFDRVINDYESLEVSKQAMIDLGDSLKQSKPRTATELYKRALFKTKDMNIASNAAFKLTDSYLMLKDGANAAIYAEKILSGNPAFLIKNKMKSFEMAKNLYKLKAYQSAYETLNTLIKNLNTNDDGYDEMLSLIGDYAVDSGDISGAKSFYNRYITEMPNSKKVPDIQSKLDKLNFGSIENKTNGAKLKDYEEVIKKYPNDPISKKALVKKAEILFAEKRCDELLKIKTDVLTLQKELSDSIVPMISSCEKSRVISQLKRGDCSDALMGIKTNLVKLEAEHDGNLYNCMMKTSSYEQARDLATRHISEQNPLTKLTWLSKLQKSYARLSDHKNVISLSRDIMTLAKTLNQPSYNMVAYEMFASAVSIQNIETMIEAAKTVESLYPNMPESLFVYKEMLKYAIKKNDNLTALNYSKKMFELQNKLKVFADTPWLEFTYSDLLAKNNDNTNALITLATLKDKKLSPNDKARQLYNASVLWQKQGKKDTAKKLLTECSSLKDDSSWRKLCKDGLELY